MEQDKKENSRRTDKDFVKIYRAYMRALADLGLESPGALCVFLFLVKNMDGTNAISISMETIASFVSMSRQTVSKHLKFLASKGWIKRIQLGRTTIYAVNDCVAWTSYGDQKEYSKFNLTAVLDKDASTVEREYYDSVYQQNWNIVKEAAKHNIRIVAQKSNDRIETITADDLPHEVEENID